METFRELIEDAVARRASDIHICAGTAPAARVDGGLIPLRDYKCTPDDVLAVTREIISPEHAAEVAAVGDGTKVPTSTTMTVKISKDGALTYGTGDLDTAVKGVVAEGSYTFKSKKYKGTAGHDITITLTNGKAGWTEPA